MLEVYALGALWGGNRAFLRNLKPELILRLNRYFQTAETLGEYIKQKEQHVRRRRAVNFSVWGTRSNFDMANLKELGWRGGRGPDPGEPYILE